MFFRQRFRQVNSEVDEAGAVNHHVRTFTISRNAVTITLSKREAIACLLLLLFAGFLLIRPSTIKPASGLATSQNDAQLNTVMDKLSEKALPRRCTLAEKELQAKFLEIAHVRGCPPKDDAWLRLVQANFPHAKVFVDIGSNKGYAATRFFELWTPELGLDSPTLHKAHRKVSQHNSLIECGACRDCQNSDTSYVPILPRICSTQAEATGIPEKRASLLRAINDMCKEKIRHFTPIKVYSF